MGFTWTALNRPGDASNNEQECYRSGNVAVSGSLTLTARHDSSCSGYSYTSAMIQWSSFSFTYGHLTVDARLAGGSTWPAIWLLGHNCQATNPASADNSGACQWDAPGSDEIDIAEVLGGDHSHVNEQIHSGGSSPGCSAAATTTGEHVYRVDWSPGRLVWSIDGRQTCVETSSVPSTPMFLILNVAIGGSGGGTPDPSMPPTASVIYSVSYAP